MGMFTNPLGHAGYPPRVTGTPETQPSEVRAATPAEITAAKIDYAYISPKNMKSAVVIVGAGASPQTVNARYGQVTFSGVSIAAGATQSFTISNSVVSGSSTSISIDMYGATTGSSLSIQSVTNSASQTVIVVQNGTGATTSTANITFVFQVMN